MPERRFIAVEFSRVLPGFPRKTKSYWRIEAVGPDGKTGRPEGWNGVRFVSYAKCKKAICFMEATGGSYEEFRQWLHT